MSEDLALSLLEELLTSQQDLVSDLQDLTLQIESCDSVEFKRSSSAHAGH